MQHNLGSAHADVSSTKRLDTLYHLRLPPSWVSKLLQVNYGPSFYTYHGTGRISSQHTEHMRRKERRDAPAREGFGVTIIPPLLNSTSLSLSSPKTFPIVHRRQRLAMTILMSNMTSQFWADVTLPASGFFSPLSGSKGY